MFKLQYYCQDKGNERIRKLLIDIKIKYDIQHEILDGAYDEDKDKEVYERKFKPRAKILKKRTGKPITQLRSRKARHYFISIPGTITIIRDEEIEWYAIGDKEIIKFLEEILNKGLELFSKISNNATRKNISYEIR